MAKKYPLIVFSGMDGTGKTTLAKKVKLFLEEKGFECEFIHGHGYSASQNSFAVNEKQINRMRYLFRFLIPLAFADNLYSYLSKHLPVLRKRALVCDRYFYDKVARLIFYGICTEKIAKIYLKFLPRPDYIFFLDLNVDKVYKRKQEYTREEYASFSKIYRFIAECLDAPIIDTSISIDRCCDEIFNMLNIRGIHKQCCTNIVS